MGGRLAPFLGGLLVGLVIGSLVFSYIVVEVATGMPVALIIGVSMLTFIAGVLVGGRRQEKTKEIRLTGRVFDFPQGPVMVEVALKRMGSIIPVKVTQE